MSTTVEKRVVEMQFQNGQFESGAKQSMATLDKLKEKLNFEACSKGLNSLSENAKNFSLKAMGSSVDAVTVKFSAMQIAFQTAISKMTSQAIDFGKGLLYSNSLTQGFGEYELEMNSVQTIMASTGETLSTVMGYLDELNTYADQTIYSFSDMTSNIGKFTNAGVKLEKAVAAIKGISNEAAVSGANANEASRAMYNFAQALSAGYVKLIDWKSIETANMSTMEFKQQLIDTAVALGTLTQAADGTYTTLEGNSLTALSNFNETLQDQWMTTDVLVDTLNKYADATTDIGKKAYSAAADVKTFTQLLDTLNEAAGSGWAKTFQIIIGDFEEAKKLFTGMSDEFGGIIQNISDSRNNLLEGALGGMSGNVSESFHEAYDAVLTLEDGIVDTEVWSVLENAGLVTDSLKTSLIDAAIASGELEKGEDGIYRVGSKVVDVQNNFVETLKESWLTSNNVCSALQDIGAEQVKLASNTENAKETLSVFQDEILEVAKKHGVAYDEMISAEENFQNILQNGKLSGDIIDEVISNLENGLKSTKDGIEELDSAVFNCGLSFQQVSDLAKEVIKGNWGNGQERYDALMSAGFDWNTIQSYVDYLIKGGEASDYFWYSQLQASDAVKENIDYTSEQVEALKLLKQQADASGQSIEDYISVMTRKTGRELLIDSFKNLYETAKTVFTSIKQGFRDIFPKTGSEALYQFINKFNKLTTSLVDGVKAKANTIRSIFKGLFAVIDILLKPIKLLVDLIGFLGSKIPPFAGGILDVAASVGEVLATVNDLIDRSGIYQTILSNIKAVLNPVLDILGWLYLKMSDVIAFLITFSNTGFSKVITGIQDTTISLKKQLDVWNVYGNIANVFKVVIGAFKTFGKWIVNITKKILSLPAVKGVIDDFGGAFGKVFNNIGSLLSDSSKAIGDFKKDISNLDGFSFKNIGKGLSSFFENIVKGIGKGIGNLLSPIGDSFVNTFKKIGEAIQGLADKNPIVKTVIDFLKNMFTALGDLGSKMGGGASSGANILVSTGNNIKNAFSGFGDVFSFIQEKIFPGLKKFMGVAKNVFGGLTALFLGWKMLKGINKVANGLSEVTFAVVKIVNSVANIVQGVANVINNIAGAIGQFANLERAVATNLRARSIQIVVTALVELIAAVVILTYIGPEKLWPAVGVIAVLALIMIGLMLAFSKLSQSTKKTAKTAVDLAALSGVIMAFGAAVLLLAISFRIIDGVKNVWQSLLIFAVMVGGLILVCKQLGKNSKETATAAAALTSFAATILIISIALKMLGSMKLGAAIQGVVIISILIFEMVAVCKIMSAFPEGNSKSAGVLLAFGASLILLAMSLQILSTIETESLLISLAVMQQLILSMVGIMIVSLFAGKYAWQAGVAIAAMGVALLAMSFALVILSNIKTEKALSACLILGIIIVEISALMLATNVMGKHAWQALPMLIGVSAALLAMVACIVILSLISLKDIAKGELAMIGIIAMLKVLMKCPKESGEVKTTIFSMAALMIILVGSILILSMLSAQDIIKSTVALLAMSACLVAMTYVLKTLKGTKTKDLIKQIAQLTMIIAIVAVMALLGAVLAELAPIDNGKAESFLLTCTAMTTIMGGLTACITVLKKFNVSSVDVLKIGTALGAVTDIFVLLIGGLLTLIGYLDELTDGKIYDSIMRGLKIIDAMATGIGEAIGHFVGSIASAFSQSLPTIGSNIYLFGEKIKPFFDTIAGIEYDTIKKLNTVVKSLGSLTASGFVSSISSIFGGGVAGLGEKLKTFGSALQDFCSSISEMTTDDIKRVELASKATEALVKAANNMPRHGGWLQKIIGESEDLGAYSVKLAAFGAVLISYAKSVSTLTDEDIEQMNKSTKAAQAIVDLSKSLPKQGGWIQKILGSQDLADFGKKMSGFGSELVKFRDAIIPAETEGGTKALSDEDLEFIKALPDYINPIVDMAKNLPNTGGLASIILGDNDLGEFGTKIGDFGKGLVEFATSVADIPTLRTDDAAASVSTAGHAAYIIENVADPLVDLANKIPNDGTGIFNIFPSVDKLKVFSSQLGLFGQGISEFCANIVEISDGGANMKTVCDNAGPLVDLGVKIVEAGDGWFSNTMGDIKNFADNMEPFGEGLKTFYDKCKTIENVKWGAINSVIYAVTELGADDATGAFENIGYVVNADDFKTNVKSLADGVYSFYTKLKDVKLEEMSGLMSLVNRITDVSDAASALNEIDDITTLGEEMTTFTEALKTSINNLDGITIEEVDGKASNYDRIINSLYRITNFARTCSDVDWNAVDSCVAFLDDLVTFAQTAGSTDTLNLEAFVNNIEIAAQNAITAFTSTFNDSTESAKTAADTFIGNIISSLRSETNITDLKVAGAQALSALISGGTSTESLGEIESWAGTIISELNGTLIKCYSNLTSMGQFIVQGLADGITNNKVIATDAIANVVQGVMDTITTEAVIESPSHITTEYGEYITKGLAVGILNAADEAENAGKVLTNKTLDAISNPLNSVNDILTGNYSSPIISPILDVTNMKLGFRTIDTLFAQQQAMDISGTVDSETSKSVVEKLENLTRIGQSLLDSINQGGDVYLNENLIIGRINRRLGSL